MSARARKAAELKGFLKFLQIFIERADPKGRRELQSTYNLATQRSIVAQNYARGTWVQTLQMPTYDPDPGERIYYETAVCARSIGKHLTKRWPTRRAAVRGHNAMRKFMRRGARDLGPLVTHKYRKRR